MSLASFRSMIVATTAIAAAVTIATAEGTSPVSPGAAELLDPGYVAKSVCGPALRRKTEVFNPGFLLAATAAAAAAVPAAAEPDLYGDLGSLTWKVTTKSPEAQAYFDQGLRLAYAFNHPEAARAFRAAQRKDPTCAMCYWGEAYVLGPNINLPMMPDAVAPAFAAVAQAQALASGATAKEQALIAATARRYSANPAADRKALDAAYADAMTAVAARYPEDDQVQLQLADALMNVQPWDYWQADRATPKGRAAEQLAAIETVLARSPDHPGAIHLYIHTVEASTDPERALAGADRLAGLMPGAGHLVHMPAHIYYRVGRYLDSLEVNRKAVAVDEAFLAKVGDGGIYPNSYYPHNVHFVLASALMAGDGPQAVAAAEKLSRLIPDQVARDVSALEAIKQGPYFAHARFSDPATVLALPEPAADFPFLAASRHYARGVARVRQGDLAGAAIEREALAGIAAGDGLSRVTAWLVPAPEILRTATLVLDGRIARAKGDLEAAAAAFTEAARLQDALPYMEPPFWYYPVRQSLAAVLLEAGRAEEARATFQASLVDAPNNAFALYGLMRAQETLGDAAGAAATKARFAAAWAGGATMPDLATL